MIAVTITGADDNVDARELSRLSQAYPFVEWGILDSYNRRGQPRYPSNDWLHWLGIVSLDHWCKHGDDSTMRLSSHVCGSRAREVMTSGGAALFHGMFVRAQINGWHNEFAAEFGHRDRRRFEWILQCRSEADLQQCAWSAKLMGHTSVLFDPSGGKGLEPFRWPCPPYETKVGFAGGINPENVERVIGEIVQACGRSDFWIDMESGVRTEDRLDLVKVESVLKTVANINAGLSSLAEAREAL